MKVQNFSSDLYQDINKWQDTYYKILDEINNFNFSPKNIKGNILQLEYLYTQLDGLHTYSLIQYELNVNNPAKMDDMRKIEQLYELISDKCEDINGYVKNNLQHLIDEWNDDKELQRFSYYYQNIFPHEFSEDDSITILYNRMDLSNNYDHLLYKDLILCEFKHNNEEVTIYKNDLVPSLNNSDREYRKKTYLNCIKSLSEISSSAAFIINSNYQIQNYISINQGFSDYFEKSINNSFFKITKEEYSNQEIIVKNLFKEMIDIRRKLLGYTYMSHYDLYYLGEEKNEISFDKAKHIITSALSVLGEEYSSILRKVFEEGWIHYEESNQKKFGARSYSSYNTHPYIIMNWSHDIESLFALVHEIGGAIAQYLSQRSGSILYSETSILKTEFASFLNEILLIKYLINVDNHGLSTLSLKLKLLEILKDDYFIPFEYLSILKVLSEKASNEILTEDIINSEYDGVIRSFRSYSKFKDIEVNKYNWIKGHDGLRLEYNLFYAIGFMLAMNFYDEQKKPPKIVELYQYGERINDYDFFKSIIPNELEIKDINKICIQHIKNILKELNGELDE
ncbi:hypothetical protein ABEZ57_13340 [Bacillus mycoides]|uniref:hypothetical protein n=1 Tax=Bacillus mycoides TaxID=1405 RepID=UPI003D221C07